MGGRRHLPRQQPHGRNQLRPIQKPLSSRRQDITINNRAIQLPRDKESRNQSPSTRAIDSIKGIGQTKQINCCCCSCRHRPPHPPSLNGQAYLVVILPFAWLRSGADTGMEDF